MTRRFVCLANSYKEGGRCVAGIELDSKGNFIIENDRPKWIRPISHSGHGEIAADLVSGLNILDIVEIEIEEECPDNYQSENVHFVENSIELSGKLSKAKLNKICEDTKYIFATRYPSISEEVIVKLSHSLILIKTETFEVTAVPNDNESDHQKLRLKFVYNEIEYDLPITDPDFLNRYRKNSKILDKQDEIVLCVSLGVKFIETGRYYKLIAGIIY